MRPQEKVNILMVDDRPENLLALEAVLEPLNQNLVPASSGEEALKRLLIEDYAVILLDVQMPGLDGFETAEQIKKREKTRDIPIIFLTAISREPHHALRGYSTGAVDYISKPFDPWVLRAKVSVFIELHQKTQLLKQQTGMLEAANKELEAFIYTVSHDLNGPLVAIQGYIDYLGQDYGELLPDEGRFYVERIGASAHYMQALIRDLLEYSRVGRMQTEVEEVKLSELIPDIAEEVRQGYADLKVVAEGDLPSVAMNPIRARQLFTNLLQNSAKYADRSDVEVRVAAVENEDGRTTISVADNGPGIPREHREKVFGVFERIDSPKGPEGTGIGLAICKKIVESAGGRIWVADTDAGTDMRIVLPRKT